MQKKEKENEWRLKENVAAAMIINDNQTGQSMLVNKQHTVPICTLMQILDDRKRM